MPTSANRRTSRNVCCVSARLVLHPPVSRSRSCSPAWVVGVTSTAAPSASSRPSSSASIRASRCSASSAAVKSDMIFQQCPARAGARRLQVLAMVLLAMTMLLSLRCIIRSRPSLFFCLSCPKHVTNRKNLCHRKTAFALLKLVTRCRACKTVVNWNFFTTSACFVFRHCLY